MTNSPASYLFAAGRGHAVTRDMRDAVGMLMPKASPKRVQSNKSLP
jgi:hypothetical protein